MLLLFPYQKIFFDVIGWFENLLSNFIELGLMFITDLVIKRSFTLNGLGEFIFQNPGPINPRRDKKGR